MSALTLKGPYWATVRQHRRTLWAVPALVAAGLAAVVALRAWAGDPDSDRMTVPSSNHGATLLRLFMEAANTGLLFLPLLVGAFVAGPMTARELESGTWRLALTQSATAKAWLGAKVLVAAAVAVLGSAALAGVYRLGWVRISGTYQFHWADRGTYEATGPVLVGYCLLGVAIGALVGQLVRRTLAAMAVTGLLTGLVLLGLGALRWSFLSVETNTVPFPGSPAKLIPHSALLMDSGLLTATGERLPEYACFARTHNLRVCPADMHITARYAEFHPASHYWPTQLIETSLLLALTAALLYAAFRLVRARHG
ncbi:ABC transporter permease subunit [Streptomyces sp. ISL-94]|uniref:ABC transporter permease subunit n=1 Tax=Streptomyces sp. ISL-94 TaxID=2819190 RepID=UPI001BE94570|nr:ABC transporter permease subunit [Streptomyces sp. ISL-94]MBT2482407.1 ABC transporter permease [Streptomyces sp. ISL-94]